MTGYQKMQRALARSVLSRPRRLFERLVFPMMRAAFQEGFAAGYATGHIDGQTTQPRLLADLQEHEYPQETKQEETQ